MPGRSAPTTLKIYPTQIEAYLNCPRKYRYARDMDLRRKYSKASPHLVLGNAVHDALQMFFDITKTKVAERTYERLCELLRDAWGGRGIFKRNKWKQDRSREEAFGGDRDEEKAWGEKGLNILYRFFQTQDTTVVPLTAEQFHEQPLNDRVTLAGKIDRIDRNPDGSLVIIDYKTGKPKLPWIDKKTAPEGVSHEELVERALADTDLQLAAYAIVVSRKFRGRVARCEYMYLNDELTPGFTPDDDLLVRKEAELLEICDRILADWSRDDAEGYEAFEATPNPLCGWCDFSEICEKGKAYLAAKDAEGGKALELPF